VQVTLPEEGTSFALIYSIEDPAGNSSQSGVGAQARRRAREARASHSRRLV